jgi:hypothetical protein
VAILPNNIFNKFTFGKKDHDDDWLSRESIHKLEQQEAKKSADKQTTSDAVFADAENQQQKTVAPSDYQKKETSPEPEQKTQKAQKEDWKPLEWSMNQHNGLDQDEVNRLLQQEAEKTAPKPSASNQTDPLPPSGMLREQKETSFKNPKPTLPTKPDQLENTQFSLALKTLENSLLEQTNFDIQTIKDIENPLDTTPFKPQTTSDKTEKTTTKKAITDSLSPETETPPAILAGEKVATPPIIKEKDSAETIIPSKETGMPTEEPAKQDKKNGSHSLFQSETPSFTPPPPLIKKPVTAAESSKEKKAITKDITKDAAKNTLYDKATANIKKLEDTLIGDLETIKMPSDVADTVPQKPKKTDNAATDKEKDALKEPALSPFGALAAKIKSAPKTRDLLPRKPGKKGNPLRSNKKAAGTDNFMVHDKHDKIEELDIKEKLTHQDEPSQTTITTTKENRPFAKKTAHIELPQIQLGRLAPLPLIGLALASFFIAIIVIGAVWSLFAYFLQIDVESVIAAPLIIFLIASFICGFFFTKVVRGSSPISIILIMIIVNVIALLLAGAADVSVLGFILKLIISIIMALAASFFARPSVMPRRATAPRPRTQRNNKRVRTKRI